MTDKKDKDATNLKAKQNSEDLLQVVVDSNILKAKISDEDTPELERKLSSPLLINVLSKPGKDGPSPSQENEKNVADNVDHEKEKEEETVDRKVMREGDDEKENKSADKEVIREEVNEQERQKGPVVDRTAGIVKSNENGKTSANNHGMVDYEEITKADDDVAVIDIPDGKNPVAKSGKDEADAASVISYFMEHDARYYFQHPYIRLFIAYFVTFCNFLIYAEDPVAHSMKECNIPLIGNDFAFVCTRYPPNAFSLLKVVLWLFGIFTGLLVGKILVHSLLFTRLFRLKMFSEDQGSWMVMFLASLITIFIFSWLYNAFLLAGGDRTEPYRISDLMGLTNSIFMKAAACGTWCGDFFTAWMVTDMMLQEKLYPKWGVAVKRWWNHKYNRIILFWCVTLITTFIVMFVIATDYIQWDKLNRDFLPTNELSRAFLASFILVMDILIVCQDWDFPHFISAIDIKMPGVNTAHIKFTIPKCLKREVWQVHITGKWFNYGILFIVMILDLNMWKNQIFYEPFLFGQYTDSDGKIHTVLDEYSLNNFNKSLLTWEYRNKTINPLTNQTYLSGDSMMNTRYYGYIIGVKGIAFIPAIFAFVTFGVLIWMFGRFKPTKDDPYAGRLKKRRKRRRFSFRNLSNSFRKLELRRKVQAVPKLLYFRKKQEGISNVDDNGSAGFPENWQAPGE